MKKKLLLICMMLMISPKIFAEDVVPEICAGGAGTIFVGYVTGQKYCMSNKNMNWWNAGAWCDGLKMKWVSLDDCACSGTTDCVNKCPEFKGLQKNVRVATPYGIERGGTIWNGAIGYDRRELDWHYAMCKM